MRNEVCNVSYWNIGRRINHRKNVTRKTIEQLAADTGQEVIFYYRAARFQKVWQDGLTPTAKRIAWSCHIELLPIADAKRREYYAQRCLNNWGRNELRRAIRRDEYALAMNGLLAQEPLKAGELPYFTYKARLLRVIDGDTLEVEIDLGFNTRVTHVIRLRGVNCAEIKSLPQTAGRALAAKAFTEAKLKEVPFITVKTHKTDIYGRYVADVFYVPAENPGKTAVYLNQEILDQGMGERMG